MALKASINIRKDVASDVSVNFEPCIAYTIYEIYSFIYSTSKNKYSQNGKITGFPVVLVLIVLVLRNSLYCNNNVDMFDTRHE